MIVRMKKDVTEEDFLMATFGGTEFTREFDIEYMKNNDLSARDLDAEGIELLDAKYEVEAKGLDEYDEVKIMFGFKQKSFEKLFEIIKE